LEDLVVMMRSNFQRLMALAAVLAPSLFAFPAAQPAFSDPGPFNTLLGSWGGTGEYSLADGTRERIKCNAYYTGGGSQLGKRHFSTAEMLRTPQFYTLYAMFVLVATGGLMITANAGPIAASWGFSAGALVLALTAFRRSTRPSRRRRLPAA